MLNIFAAKSTGGQIHPVAETSVNLIDRGWPAIAKSRRQINLTIILILILTNLLQMVRFRIMIGVKVRLTRWWLFAMADCN